MRSDNGVGLTQSANERSEAEAAGRRQEALEPGRSLVDPPCLLRPGSPPLSGSPRQGSRLTAGESRSARQG